MADITKYATVDPRITQEKPKYAVEIGAQSITNQTFSAISNSASQQTFQVQVPSENIFVDRAVDWVNKAYVQVTLTFSGAKSTGNVLVTPGVDFSLAPFPTTQSVSTMQATINDQTVNINMADVLPQILRLSDMAKTRKQRTCPTMLDRYYSVKPASTFANSPVGSYGSAFSSDEVPNGAWGDLNFYVPAGNNTVAINAAGLPVVAVGGNGLSTFTFGVWWKTAEKLVLPPFIFADEDELSTGLFGCQNLSFTCNFNAPGRSLRISGGGITNAVVAWDSVTPGNGSPFALAQIQAQFLTPALKQGVPLPAKSVVKWSEYPRYISPVLTVVPGSNSSIQSQTITLPMIPDLLVMYVKPQQYANASGNLDPLQSDWVMPISNISLTFDNFSGLLSNHSQYELYKMSVNNGLEMDWDEWSGEAWAAGSKTALVGGPLVLRPGRDFALSPGQAPGIIGNFTLQMTLTIQNYNNTYYPSAPNGSSAASYGQGVSIYTVTANSGFFETVKGASRILRGVLTEQDILAAPVSEPSESGERMVGEGKRCLPRKKGMHAYLR